MRRLTLIFILISLLVLTTTASAQDDERYIINPDENSVTVIDPETGDAETTIAVGLQPVGLVVLADTNRLYVANAGDQTITVIDTDTNEVVATLPLPEEPLSLVADARTSRVYIAHPDSTTIIDGETVVSSASTGTVNRMTRPSPPRFTVLPPLTAPAAASPLMLPASPLCLEAGDTFLTNLPPDLIDLQCRILAEDEEFIQNPGEIGADRVLELGVIHAVDIFSPSDTTVNNIIVCMRGSGSVIFLDAEDWPREPRILLASETQGYTCSLLPDLGTLVLVD